MYKLQSLNRKGDFVLLKNEIAIGSLTYKKRSLNAKVNFEDKLIEIRAKTLWKRTITIYNNTSEIGGLTFNWKSHGVINLIDSEKNNVSFILKRKSFGKRIEVYSAGKSLLFTMKRSKVNWKTFNYNYDITINLEVKYYSLEEILMYSVYTLNLYRRNGQ
jgi:hypothetical protein